MTVANTAERIDFDPIPGRRQLTPDEISRLAALAGLEGALPTAEV
jgi:hypothetical protein